MPYHWIMASSRRTPSWQIWSNILLFFGAGGCTVLLLWSFGLIGYYSFKRPREPIPQRGWNKQLHWTGGCYGTYAEDERLLLLHDWFFPFFAMAGIGVYTRKLHEKKQPCRATLK